MTSWIPNRLREHLRVKKLQRNLAALEGDYTSQLKQAHSQSERDQLTGKWDFEEEYLEAEIGKIKTNKLVRRAKKFGIDLSAQQGWWTDDQQEYPTSFLNDSGLTQAKLLIQDRFRQSVKWWFWILTVLGGLAAGIYSFFNSKVMLRTVCKSS